MNVRLQSILLDKMERTGSYVLLTLLLAVNSISCLDEMVCTDSNDNQLSKIIFSSNIFSPFDIARDQSANTYYPNMVCTMSLTAPSGYEAYIEFSPCALDSPGSCDDEAIVTQANSASQKYCGTGNPGIYTWMNTLEATVKTDSNGQAVGCGGYILTASTTGNGRRRRHAPVGAWPSPAMETIVHGLKPKDYMTVEEAMNITRAREQILRHVVEWRKDNAVRSRHEELKRKRKRRNICPCSTADGAIACTTLRSRLAQLAGTNTSVENRTKMICDDHENQNFCVDEFLPYSKLGCLNCYLWQLVIDVLRLNLPSTQQKYDAALVVDYYMCKQVFGGYYSPPVALG